MACISVVELQTIISKIIQSDDEQPINVLEYLNRDLHCVNKINIRFNEPYKFINIQYCYNKQDRSHFTGDCYKNFIDSRQLLIDIFSLVIDYSSELYDLLKTNIDYLCKNYSSCMTENSNNRNYNKIFYLNINLLMNESFTTIIKRSYEMKIDFISNEIYNNRLFTLTIPNVSIGYRCKRYYAHDDEREFINNYGELIKCFSTLIKDDLTLLINK